MSKKLKVADPATERIRAEKEFFKAVFRGDLETIKECEKIYPGVIYSRCDSGLTEAIYRRRENVALYLFDSGCGSRHFKNLMLAINYNMSTLLEHMIKEQIPITGMQLLTYENCIIKLITEYDTKYYDKFIEYTKNTPQYKKVMLKDIMLLSIFTKVIRKIVSFNHNYYNGNKQEVRVSIDNLKYALKSNFYKNLDDAILYLLNNIKETNKTETRWPYTDIQQAKIAYGILIKLKDNYVIEVADYD